MKSLAKSLLILLACLSLEAFAAGALKDNLKIEGGDFVASFPGQRGAGVSEFAIVNTGPADKLVGATSDLAKRIEFARLYMDGTQLKQETFTSIDIPANGKYEFKKGGTGLYLLTLTGPLVAGEKVPVKLQFENAGEVQIFFPIKERPPLPVKAN